MDYKLGGKYEVSPRTRRQRKDWDGFIGELMQHDKRLFTLESEKGIRETFLKVDMKIGEYKIQAL